eukprot:TRINITY_DN70137_c0_g1_i2.p1 TRINITY_DN70137_c0_g1~~TRINITY_DN70137_c0_g1_i2.p1  ORF type:complete len:165 (+),score=31.77 TRINITY_DN70137_c0_g1_i2:60-554(+)
MRRPPRSTQGVSSAASDVYKRQYQRRVHGVTEHFLNLSKIDEILEIIRTIVSELNKYPESKLEESRTSCKRVSGLFSTWVSCIIITTKDKYLHIFDMEEDAKPVFTFDIIRTQAKIGSEPEILELQEAKRLVVLGTETTSKTIKIAFKNKDEASFWADYINKTK